MMRVEHLIHKANNSVNAANQKSEKCQISAAFQAYFILSTETTSLQHHYVMGSVLIVELVTKHCINEIINFIAIITDLNLVLLIYWLFMILFKQLLD